jgi:L-ascorbate metabolism protein UlaG (beta-lactamase superfamily)
MDKRAIRQDHRIIDGPISRRQFIKLTGRVGLVGAAKGLTGGLIVGSSYVSQAGTVETDVLPGRPYHHTGDGFRNPSGSPAHKHDLTAWIDHIWREIGRDDHEVPADHFLGHSVAAQALLKTGSGNRLTWLGHSTFLLRLGGRNILLDPFLSDYATSVPPFGPRRYTPPGLPVDKLPGIDLLIISHNHYDHLDRTTLEMLPDKDRIPVIVPLKLKEFISELGFRDVTELDWHDTKKSGPITVTAIPAVHFSSRSLFDRNETLWTGYSISDGHTKVYFSGDTGYHSIFKDLGRRYGPFDLGLVPIGAYKRASNLKSTHTTPEEAVRLGRDLDVKTLVPMHWGTLVLSYEPPFEPPVRFLKAGLASGFSEDRLWKMAVGETRVLV